MSTVTEETPQTTETTTHKWVYLFDDGPGDDKSLLGGKGAGLCEMTRAGVPVPPGLVVTPAARHPFFEQEQDFPRRHVGAGQGRTHEDRREGRQEVWRSEEPAARVRSLRRG